MLDKNGRSIWPLFTEVSVKAIQESLADFICSRCKQRYRYHWYADHFFEYTEELYS
jgi:hypothetical protein